MKTVEPDFELDEIQSQFPFRDDSDSRCHYLDNAATTQTPQTVIDVIADAYQTHSVPLARGLYSQATQADELHYQARKQIQAFIHAQLTEEIIFTTGATFSINMVAQGYVKNGLKPNDKIWITPFEHHANYLPWQQLCAQTGAELCIINLDQNGLLDWQECAGLFSEQTQFISLCLISNVTGALLPIKEICHQARLNNIPTLIDASQGVASHPIDVEQLACDFLVCSSHKMYGPKGIGILYGKYCHLENMSPTILGGGMIDFFDDTFTKNQWASIPQRFEAGSGNLPAVLGFAKAAEFIQHIGFDQIHAHLASLRQYCLSRLKEIPDLILVQDPINSGISIVSFHHRDVHPHDIAQVCADNNVAIRAGHHCAQPLMNYFNIAGTVRVSFAIYNEYTDIDMLISSVKQALELYKL